MTVSTSLAMLCWTTNKDEWMLAWRDGERKRGEAVEDQRTAVDGGHVKWNYKKVAIGFSRVPERVERGTRERTAGLRAGTLGQDLWPHSTGADGARDMPLPGASGARPLARLRIPDLSASAVEALGQSMRDLSTAVG